MGVALEPVSDLVGGEPYRVRYDPATTPPGIAVVAAVAEMRGVDPTDLDPLQHVIDTDALTELMRPRPRQEGFTRISFDYEGATVTIATTDLITVSSTSPPAEPEGARYP